MQCKACAADSTEADHAASHMGKAVGMVALLRGTAHHAQRYICPWCTYARPAPARLPGLPGSSATAMSTGGTAGRRRSYLPADLCAQARVSQEQIYRGESSDALCDVVFQTASVANVCWPQTHSLCCVCWRSHRITLVFPVGRTWACCCSQLHLHPWHGLVGSMMTPLDGGAGPP